MKTFAGEVPDSSLYLSCAKPTFLYSSCGIKYFFSAHNQFILTVKKQKPLKAKDSPCLKSVLTPKVSDGRKENVVWFCRLEVKNC